MNETMTIRNFFAILYATLVVSVCSSTTIQAKDTIEFGRDIRPILSDKCFACHGPDMKANESGLRLDIAESATESAIVVGKPDESAIIERITTKDPELMMPPAETGKEVTAEELKLLKQWIADGAEYESHWAFEVPKQPDLPAVKAKDWPKNPIDFFTLKKMESEGLSPQVEADRRTLLRRVKLDLTGLPPTMKEIDAFLKDTSPNAYEKMVDRFLDSPHFGERMAVMWLDAARYGDTSVFHADGYRDMWRWRDRVVRSYNDNLPFDEFSTEQLAGDLLPEPTLEQLIASGFNRNNGTTDEGGLIEEEYRVEYAVDRVKTTSMVWLGLTMECSQCHDHKYDPISQKEYYEFYAFFNRSADRGRQTRRGNAEPKIDVPDPDKLAKLPGVENLLKDQEAQIEQHRKSSQPALETWIAERQAEVDADGMTDLSVSGAIAHLPLNENKGNSVGDLIDSKRKGTIKGPAKWAPSKADVGLKLEGKTYVDLGNVGDFERTEGFSYGCWVKADKNPAGAIIARMDDTNKHRGYDLFFSGKRIAVHIIHEWPGNAIKVTMKEDFKPDEWHHVFATYDGSSKAKGIKIYVDGKEREWNIEQNALSKTIKTDKPLYIGSRHPGSKLKAQIDDVRIFNRELTSAEVEKLYGSDPLAPIFAIKPEKRTPAQQKTLSEYFFANEDPAYQKLLKERDRLRSQIAELKKPLTTVMVMRDMPKPRETFVLDRGMYDAPTKVKVLPGTPSFLPPMAGELPRNRLGLSKWLFSPEHPLTARVAVNRYWQLLFGIGLVDTPQDFGSQGSFPSHPELLDWLAVDFRENDWDIKRAIKQMVMSATYRQSSQAETELYKTDPDNRMLARGPRFRLQAEFLRDNTLAISGLLHTKMGGPGVKTYQPPGLWAEVGLSGKPVFKRDNGEKLFRRSLYSYWKRSAPPPSLQIFDAPTREKCTVYRPRTNTPLQALVTLNDVQYVEAARNLAQRMLLESPGKSDGERLAYGFELSTARVPDQSEIDIFAGLLADSRAIYTKNASAATDLLSLGESPRDESLDAAEHAAWTVIANLILNLDETLTRE